MIACPVTTGVLRHLLGGRLTGDEGVTISGVSEVATAEPCDVICASHSEQQLLATCRAGLLLAGEGTTALPGGVSAVLAVRDPESALDWCRRYFRARAEVLRGECVAADDGVLVGAGCSIGAGATVGAWCVLFPGACVAPGAVLGAGCVVRPRAVLASSVEIGARCEIGAGAVIGSECERYEPGRDAWRRTPGSGSVVIGDDVSIGPLTVIEKGFRENTRIGSGSILGGQVYISHDCTVGTSCLIIGQSGLASGVAVGDAAALMARVAVNSNVRIGDGALVFAGSGVFGDVPPHAQVLGHPARPRRQALRAMALPRQVEALRLRLARMEKQDSASKGAGA